MARFLSLAILVAVTLLVLPQSLYASATGDADSLVIGVATRPGSGDPRFVGFDPMARKLEELRFLPLFFRDMLGELRGAIAESFETPTPLRWRIAVRKGLWFADGRQITANDVVATYKYIMSSDGRGASPRKILFTNVVDIKKESDFALSFELKNPDPHFIERLKIGILPEAALALPPEELTGLGFESGPFVAVRISESQWTLHRNDRFGGSAFGLSIPRIKRLGVRFISESSLLLKSLVNGDVDLVPGDLRSYNIATIKKHYSHKISYDRFSSQQLMTIGFPLSSPIFSQESVRRAMLLALSENDVLRFAARGEGEPIGDSFSKLEASLWTKATYGGKKSLLLAQSLLDAAGFKDPDSGGPKPRFEMTLNTSKNPDEIIAAKALAAMWLPLGIKARVNIGYSPWSASAQDSQNPVLGFLDSARFASPDNSENLFIRTPLWRRLDNWFFKQSVKVTKTFSDSGFFSILSVFKK